VAKIKGSRDESTGKNNSQRCLVDGLFVGERGFMGVAKMQIIRQQSSRAQMKWSPPP